MIIVCYPLHYASVGQTFGQTVIIPPYIACDERTIKWELGDCCKHHTGFVNFDCLSLET